MRRSLSSSSGKRGSALILFLGVAAAVSVVAAALVILLINTQHGTTMDRQRTKAFNVAEAALDVSMLKLGSNWPTSATSASWFNATEEREFTLRFPSAEFPGADPNRPENFFRVQLADNVAPYKPFDANGDGLVFLDAQARVGRKAARVHAQIQVTYEKVDAMPGLALWAGGNITSTGGDPKVTAEVFPPGTTDASWAAKGQADASMGASYMNLLQGTSAPNRPLSQSKIIELTALAQSTGRYFTSTSAPASGYGGLCVIEAPSGVVQLNGGQSINTEEQPGVLLVLGGASVQFGGSTEYFGILYSAGTVGADRAHGTPIIHGMLITEGGLTGNGTPDIRYNDNVVRNLNTRFPIGSRVVLGTWRELKPTM
jgi:hypothetical protein